MSRDAVLGVKKKVGRKKEEKEKKIRDTTARTSGTVRGRCGGEK